MLQPNRRGLVFGVGSEKLPALFAARGCSILATDGPMGARWAQTNQHANNTDPLFDPKICDRKIFDDRVQFAICDMNAIPVGLRGFDFCWSASVLEHLGDLEAGLRFIENSLECLRPGGVAVHVLEYNLASNDRTSTEGDTCLYRRRDIDELVRRLLAKGSRSNACQRFWVTIMPTAMSLVRLSSQTASAYTSRSSSQSGPALHTAW
jgi:SAM-dependent methyltransferase